MAKPLIILAIMLAALATSLPAQARIVADVTQRLIAITTAFSGAQVVLFGASEPGSDVVVVVKGPARDHSVQRKDRIAGIWMNAAEVVFEDVPVFYAIATNRPMEDIADPDVRRGLDLGLDVLNLRPVAGTSLDKGELASFRQALIRNKQEVELYAREVGAVRFLGDTLFSTRIDFPNNIPPGSYDVEVLEIRDGQVVAAQSSVIAISKLGLEANLFEFAKGQPAMYGVVAILIAVVSGLLAGWVFRKD